MGGTLREIQYEIWKLADTGESFEEYLHRLKSSLEDMRKEAQRRLEEEGPTELSIVAGKLIRRRMTRH